MSGGSQAFGKGRRRRSALTPIRKAPLSQAVCKTILKYNWVASGWIVKEIVTKLSVRAPLLGIEEVEMRSITVLGIVLAACVSVPAIAIAQEPAPQPANGYHHTVHHHFHNGERHQVHRFEARRAPPATPATAAMTAAPQAAPFGLALPHIAPYPNGKGDEDGLSEDPNDCNKGCIDGNQD